ncbi:DUF4240 domain-containing protein [Hamadaea tsunoensis]|uniref:DUF4240 domain-containing protein n=1 Tax=Hamadaea tsunoensis TaxID=53368 RepID=UPI00041B1C50|nr:DUF4240 domain-containing protein [Hamadaea tsunoensis]
MELSEFWSILAAARADVDGAYGEDGATLAKALRLRLDDLSAERRAAFGEHFVLVDAAACRWDLFGAAYLIGGGCDLAGFADFRAGLIAAGEEWHTRALADPDMLAGHPIVAEAADWDDDSALYAELVATAVAEATGAAQAERELAGERWDFDDDAAMRHRLPRLSALFLGWPKNEGCRC